MPTIEVVEWGDPRAAVLREAMNLETAAMYEEFVHGQSLEEREAIDDALSVNPDDIVATIVAVDGGELVGHAALRRMVEARSLEVKKVFVVPAARGRGVARLLMVEIESIARARGVSSLLLQTGHLQVAAIALYERIGYRAVAAFGKYAAVPNALCFEKVL